MSRPLETAVEGPLVRALRRRGVLTVKLNLCGNRGWPDRLVLLPGGRAVLVELKRPGGRLRPLQEHVHAQLRALGFTVVTFDSAPVAVRWADGLGVDRVTR